MMETGVRLACILQPEAAAAVAALEATHIRRLQRILHHPEGRSQAHIKDHRRLEQIVSQTSHVPHQRQSALTLQPSVKTLSRRGRT